MNLSKPRISLNQTPISALNSRILKKKNTLLARHVAMEIYFEFCFIRLFACFNFRPFFMHCRKTSPSLVCGSKYLTDETRSLHWNRFYSFKKHIQYCGPLLGVGFTQFKLDIAKIEIEFCSHIMLPRRVRSRFSLSIHIRTSAVFIYFLL